MSEISAAELKKRFKKLASDCFEISTLACTVTYFLFHYVTCDGITKVKQEKAGKPLLTALFGNLGVAMFSAGIISLLIPATVLE